MNLPSQPTTLVPDLPAFTFLRFSLLTLLCITTLAAFISSIVFSPHWHHDERLLLAFWCAGMILGVSFGRARGSHGVLSGALGGAVGCVLAAMFVINRFEQMPEAAARYRTVYLAFVVTVGSVAALAVAGCYQFIASGAVEILWLSKRVRGAVFVLFGGVVTVLVIRQLFREKPWQPTWEIAVKATDINDFPTLRLSANGEYLFGMQSNENINPPVRKAFVHQLTSRGMVGRSSPMERHPRNYILSPDGKWLVEHSLGDLIIHETLTGKVLQSWELGKISQLATQWQFNAAGDRLLLTTHTPRIQRLYVLNPLEAKLPQAELFPFAGRVLLDPTGEVLVKLFDAAEADGPRKVEVVRRSDGQLLGEMHDVPDLGTEYYAISPGGKYLGNTHHVWKLGSDSSTDMAGVVLGFTDDDRAIVHTEPHRQEPPELLPDWLLPMPLLQHAYDLRSYFRQLSIVDLRTGKTLTKTEPFKGMSIGMAAEQSHVVLGATWPESHVRIWKVPPRK
ncbi:hypothetical protein [Anatilimnocola floriformis]|uniref:hypothetical protein n=1 Tax=Anatilimnocola floriformis TaxID=2948575 RepID=UPI0020C35D29|nr:hypothetical protein [Anatilimnocola floriformis]